MKRAIYIPSMQRADAQKTWRHINHYKRAQIYIVVPRKEKREYVLQNIQARILTCDAVGIGETRQWIVDHANENGHRHILMIDDDMSFYRREDHGSVKLLPATDEGRADMLDCLFEYLEEGYVHVGMAKRTDAANFLVPYRVCTRVNNFHGFNTRILVKENIRFDGMLLMEDFNVTLSLLKLGYPNKVVYDYCWNQNASNMRGGCSVYRTWKRQKRAALKLHSLHPDVVKVIKRKTISKNDWKGMKKRYDVQIQWHKAFEDGLAKSEHEHWAVERAAIRKAGVTG